MYFRGMPGWLEQPLQAKLIDVVFLPIAWVVGIVFMALLAIPLLVIAFVTRHPGEKKGFYNLYG